jgi:flagellar biosynthesis protein FlhG
VSLTLVRSRSDRAFTIAVTSGKGGVGKTTVAIHLAIALAGLKRRVALVDADFALGNVDVRLGLIPDRHLGDVLDGDCSIEDVTLEGPIGIDVVPAASGIRELSVLTPAHWARLSGALAAIASDRDFVIVDTATGVGDASLDVVGLADYALVVTNDEPATLVDAYATIKLLTLADRSKPIGILANGVNHAADAERVFAQLSVASRRFLDRTIRDDGFIVEDACVRQAALRHATLAEVVATSPASRCFRRLAARLAAASVVPPDPGPAPALVRPAESAFVEAPRCA